MAADYGPYWRALGNTAVETQSEKIATNERRRRISSNFREPPAIIKKGDQLVLQKRRSRASYRTVRSTMCTLPGATARRAPVAIAIPRSPPTMECPNTPVPSLRLPVRVAGLGTSPGPRHAARRWPSSRPVSDLCNRPIGVGSAAGINRDGLRSGRCHHLRQPGEKDGQS
jgi:hypothetical protein